VTGAGGFLGGALARALLARDGTEVVTLQRGDYPWLERAGARVVRAALEDAGAVHAAAAGCDVVHHVAARAGVWGDPRAYRRTNVVGTQHVIDACRAHGVGRLVYTSTPSVVFDGRDQAGVDESRPYPARHLCAYPATKAEAERRVLAANGPELATLALRPHLIWGPGDRHLVPRVLARARAGRLRLVGGGAALVDSTYVDNAVDAHLLAADALAGRRPAAGRAYFVSNGEPRPMRALLGGILRAGGLPEERRSVPEPLAYALGALLEGWHALRRSEEEPVMTRFVARQLGRAHWFDIGAARRDLGYRPRVSLDEGLERLAAALAAPRPDPGDHGP